MHRCAIDVCDFLKNLYTIFKEGDKVFQEIADVDGTPVHTLELPDGLALEKSSYEVMLRYVLADVVNS